jgi:muconolactone delta-isomerase
MREAGDGMRFMATLGFRPDDQAQLAPLVPQEQAHVRELMGKGVVEALFVGADPTRPTVWVVLHGESQGEVEQTLHAFPMYSYMQIEYTPLT